MISVVARKKKSILFFQFFLKKLKFSSFSFLFFTLPLEQV